MLNGPDLLFTLLLVFTVVSLGYVGLIVWQRRKTSGARYLLWVMAAGMIWALCYVLEVRSEVFSLKILWAKAKYLGIVVAPVAWFLFVLDYVGVRKSVWPYHSMILFAVPALTLLAILTNPQHHLFWRLPSLQRCENLQYLQVQHAFFFWLHTAYSNLLLLGSLLVLLRALRRSHPFYRVQILTMIFALSFPWIGNVLYLTGVTPCVLRDPTPFGFLLTGFVVTIGALRFRWLDLVPVARTVVFETMQDGVIVIDSKERIVDLNPAAAKAFDVSSQEVIGTGISDVLSDRAEVVQACVQQSQVARQLTVERDSESRIYEVRVSDLWEKELGAQAGHVIMLHDVTEHVRAVEEREQLIQDLDAFAYTVAHDLKNPVGTILTAASLLRNEYHSLPPEELRVLAKVIAQGGEKTINIIDEMLVLTGVQKGIEITPRPLDMMSITDEALQRLAQTIEESNAKIIRPDQWPHALGHAPWIEEVWVNYISNAVKYGGTPPRIELGADPPVNGHVRFWIQDDGAGVADIDVERLFEPFTRFGDSSASGHGLGLSIVRRIVERLQGEVGVDSNVKQGSRFFFTLPTAQEPPVEEVET